MLDVPDQLPCLNTTVRNVSGVERFYGFLGERGRNLLANQEFTVLGGFEALLTYNDQRHRDFLAKAIQDGVLDVITTPAPHFLDHETHRVRTLGISNDGVQVIDPCWGHFSSAAQ